MDPLHPPALKHQQEDFPARLAMSRAFGGLDCRQILNYDGTPCNPLSQGQLSSQGFLTSILGLRKRTLSLIRELDGGCGDFGRVSWFDSK